MNKISFLLLSIIMFTSCESEYKLSIKAPSKAILEDKIKKPRLYRGFFYDV